MGLRVLVINPSGEESLGLLDDVLREEGAAIDEVATQEAIDLLAGPPSETARVVASLPSSSSAYDCLVILGSPLGVLTCPAPEASQNPPALIAQAEVLLRDFHKGEKPVLGLCLGAQMIARTFGGEVMPLPKDLEHTALPSTRPSAAGVEFGFHPQDFTLQAENDPVVGTALQACNGGQPAFMQWHSDTYTFPEGAVPLSSRPTCPVQAFRLGRRTYAFQYHIEVGAELGQEWYDEYAEGTASHASCGAEEAIHTQADRGALDAQLREVLDSGSVARAEDFTRSVMRSLLVEARASQRERCEAAKCRRMAGAVALAVVVGIVSATTARLARR